MKNVSIVTNDTRVYIWHIDLVALIMTISRRLKHNLTDSSRRVRHRVGDQISATHRTHASQHIGSKYMQGITDLHCHFGLNHHMMTEAV